MRLTVQVCRRHGVLVVAVGGVDLAGIGGATHAVRRANAEDDPRLALRVSTQEIILLEEGDLFDVCGDGFGVEWKCLRVTPSMET